MIKKYILFFTPTCPKCPFVKTYLEDKGLEKEWADAATPEGLEKAKEFNVMNVPTVIFFDENGKEVTRATSLEEVKKIVENKSLSDV